MRWDTDRIGLTLARLIVSRLLAADAAIEVVVDDTLFRRWGPKVFGAFWTHDGSAQDPNALGRGNRWIIIGIVVTVPFCSHPVCLPVLLRLWRGKGTASPVQLARELISILAQAFPDRLVHTVGDAAYHGKALLVPGYHDHHPAARQRRPLRCWRRRAPASGAGPGSKGAPARSSPVDLAATATSGGGATITRYCRSVIVEIADIPSIWYGAFGNTPGRTVLVREPGDDRVLAVFTTDTDSCTDAVVERYAQRWPIETAIAVGQTTARRRPGPQPPAARRGTHRAARASCVYSLVILLVHAARLPPRRPRPPPQPTSPGTPTRTEPAFEDMLAKLRRTLVAARITGVAAAQPDPHKYRDYELACAAAAA